MADSGTSGEHRKVSGGEAPTKTTTDGSASVLEVYTCVGFTGRWPVGTAAVIVAESLEHAEELMDAELVRLGLPTDKYAMISLNLGKAGAHVLCDGEY